MPTLVWLYLTALLYDRTASSCVALAEALGTVSHDRLTRLVQADWSGQRLLESAVRTMFRWERGYVSLEDTVCLVAFCVLERERHDRHLSIYQLKRQLSFRGPSGGLPALERLRSAA